MNAIRIAIADDQKVFRDGLKVSLGADDHFEILLEASNGKELIDRMAHCIPDIILMDLKMPVMDGMEATKIIRHQFPGVKILVVTMFDDDKFISYMMECGAHGYLLKNAEPAEIQRSIYAISENGYYFNDTISPALLTQLIVANKVDPTFREDIVLTSTERALLQIINSADEKNDLIYTPQMQSLAKKIGVYNKAGLILYAVKNKLFH